MPSGGPGANASAFLNGTLSRNVVVLLDGLRLNDPTAVSPEFGAYRYHAILDSLRAGGFLVLADVRPKGNGRSDENAGRNSRLLAGRDRP